MPFDPLRGERILTALAAAGLTRRELVREPPSATFKALRRVHGDDYLDRLGEAESLTRIFGAKVDAAAVDRILELQRTMTGGTILATEWALRSRHIVANLGGGLHHAGPEGGTGFCAINDVAVAIADQRFRGFRGKVLIIDLDLHDGNGTRECFAADPSVYTLSIHNQHWGPVEAQASRSVDLGHDVGDEEYLAAIVEHVPEILREHAPQLVYIVAGTDPAEEDPLGDWSISAAGMLRRDRTVHDYLDQLAPAAARVIVLAGGYGLGTWKHSARALALLQGGVRDYEPPGNAELTMMRYRHLAKVMTLSELTGEELDLDGDNWGITPEDVLPGLGHEPAPRRFLGFYAPSGLELALERYGLLDRLRAKGYARPTPVFDTSDRETHTMRIFGDAERQQLLIEVRLRRDRRTIAGFELLFVEWLLLQHPAGRFTRKKPRLPGQEHPGLGLFFEVVGLLILICERLKLDGLAVVPSQYHLAVHWHRRLRFVDPGAAARFGALQQALAGLDLGEASQALADQRLWDENADEPSGYQAAPMILPHSAELRRHLAAKAPEFRRLQEKAAAALDLRLRPAPGGADDEREEPA
jgi:acetoin utilization deacetylase AcuC-like enzyme